MPLVQPGVSSLPSLATTPLPMKSMASLHLYDEQYALLERVADGRHFMPGAVRHNWSGFATQHEPGSVDGRGPASFHVEKSVVVRGERGEREREGKRGSDKAEGGEVEVEGEGEGKGEGESGRGGGGG